jgi:hypothetical protein
MQPFVPGNDAMDMGGLLTFRCGEKHVKKNKKTIQMIPCMMRVQHGTKAAKVPTKCCWFVLNLLWPYTGPTAANTTNVYWPCSSVHYNHH